MDPAFAEAFINREHIQKDGSRFSHHVVMGRRLRPFCLWHSFLLAAIGNPLMSSDVFEVSDEDFEIAVNVLARGWQPLELRSGMMAQLRRVWYAERLGRERLRLMAYLADYKAEPTFTRGGKSKPVKTPWQLFRVGQLMRYGHMSLRQAWECPVGEAVWLATALAEAGGASVNLLSESMREALREAGHDA